MTNASTKSYNQVDFHGGGSLAVAGADADAARIGAFIRANLGRITAIYVTLDTHQVGVDPWIHATRPISELIFGIIIIQRLHISHGAFWRGPDGAPPPPFTRVALADVQTEKWTPVDPEKKVRTVL